MDSKKDCTQLREPGSVLTQLESQEGPSAAPGGLELHGSLSNGDAAAPDSLPKAAQRLNSVVQSWRVGSQGWRG